MIYTTRKEIADAVLNEYDRVLGSHIQQLYNCKNIEDDFASVIASALNQR